jgi:hypothetical protein
LSNIIAGLFAALFGKHLAGVSEGARGKDIMRCWLAERYGDFWVYKIKGKYNGDADSNGSSK